MTRSVAPGRPGVGGGDGRASAVRVFARSHGCVGPDEALVAAGWTTDGEAVAVVRRRRLARWLRDRRVALDAAVVAVLARCDSASEVRFALGVMAGAPGWSVGGPNYLVHPDLLESAVGSPVPAMLVVQAPVGGYRLDFLLGAPRESGLGPAVGIEIDGPTHYTAAGAARDAERAAVIAAAGYRIVRIPADGAQEAGEALGRSLFE